jgi:hypothetical protein
MDKDQTHPSDEQSDVGMEKRGVVEKGWTPSAPTAEKPADLTDDLPNRLIDRSKWKDDDSQKAKS